MNALTPSAVARRKPVRNIGLGQLRYYRLPLPGVVSILHRVSGALMVVALPGLLWLFELSLRSEHSYDRLLAWGASVPVRLSLLILTWALLHHLCAGVRFLLLDLHWGLERGAARRSSVLVLALSLALTLVCALSVFGVL